MGFDIEKKQSGNSVTGMDRPKGMEGKKYATWDLDIEKATLKQVVEKDGGDFSKEILIRSEKRI